MILSLLPVLVLKKSTGEEAGKGGCWAEWELNEQKRQPETRKVVMGNEE